MQAEFHRERCHDVSSCNSTGLPMHLVRGTWLQGLYDLTLTLLSPYLMLPHVISSLDPFGVLSEGQKSQGVMEIYENFSM